MSDIKFEGNMKETFWVWHRAEIIRFFSVIIHLLNFNYPK